LFSTSPATQNRRLSWRYDMNIVMWIFAGGAIGGLIAVGASACLAIGNMIENRFGI